MKSLTLLKEERVLTSFSCRKLTIGKAGVCLQGKKLREEGSVVFAVNEQNHLCAIITDEGKVNIEMMIKENIILHYCC
jgi:hypothetical protein